MIDILSAAKIGNFTVKSECDCFKLSVGEFNQEVNGFTGEIIDNNDFRMPFVFRPALDIRVARTLIVLHGHGANQSYSKFKDDKWNVIAPLDQYGTGEHGSWWLGESGDFRTYHLLQNLIKMLNKHYQFSNLYFWGSSMGGYGAIVHGFELKASAIYSHIPQIKLKGTTYTDGGNAKFYHHLVDDGSKYQNLNVFISEQRVRRSPVLFLSQNSKDTSSYVDQHFIPFIKKCNSKGFAYSVVMPLVNGHVGHLNVARTVKEVFEAHYKKIKSWRVSGEI